MNLAMAELLLSDFINPFYFFPVKIYNVSVSNACIYVYYVYEVDPNDGHQKKIERRFEKKEESACKTD